MMTALMRFPLSANGYVFVSQDHFLHFFVSVFVFLRFLFLNVVYVINRVGCIAEFPDQTGRSQLLQL